MGVIAIYSIKGGVGKTTTAFDLAWRSAAIGGQRTLLWDLDLQGGAAFLLDEDQPRVPRAAGAFRPGGLLRQQIRPTRHEGLHLLPSDPSLRILPAELARLRQRQRLTALTHLLSGEFTRIVLDCPPALNEISDQIMAAADLVIVPLPPSPLSMRALEAIRTELAHNHRNAPPLMPVLTMLDTRRKLHREALDALDADWPVVPFSSEIERIAAERAPIDSFAKRSKGAQALAALYAAVEDRLAALPPRLPGPPLRAFVAEPEALPAAPPEPDHRFRSFLQKLLRV